MKTFLIILLSIVLGVLVFFSAVALAHPVFAVVYGMLFGGISLSLYVLISHY